MARPRRRYRMIAAAATLALAAAGANFVGANCGLCNTQWTVQQKNLSL